MHLSLKPIRWDDLVARHDPDSLPFWRFYVEVRDAQLAPARTNRLMRWLKDAVEQPR